MVHSRFVLSYRKSYMISFFREFMSKSLMLFHVTRSCHWGAETKSGLIYISINKTLTICGSEEQPLSQTIQKQWGAGIYWHLIWKNESINQQIIDQRSKCSSWSTSKCLSLITGEWTVRGRLPCLLFVHVTCDWGGVLTSAGRRSCRQGALWWWSCGVLTPPPGGAPRSTSVIRWTSS